MNLRELESDESTCRRHVEELRKAAKVAALALLEARRSGTDAEIEAAKSKYDAVSAELAEREKHLQGHVERLESWKAADKAIADRHGIETNH